MAQVKDLTMVKIRTLWREAKDVERWAVWKQLNLIRT